MLVRYLGFGFLLAAMLAVFAVMALRIAPRIQEAAGGRKLFDARLGGYDFDEAQEFLKALTPEATKTYLKMATQWDMVFPLLYGAFLMVVIIWATPDAFPIDGAILALIVLPAVYCDFRENALVAAMLIGGPDHLTPKITSNASFWTVWKWRLTALAAGVALAMVVVGTLWPARAGEGS